jgi:hypothetical protein
MFALPHQNQKLFALIADWSATSSRFALDTLLARPTSMRGCQCAESGSPEGFALACSSARHKNSHATSWFEQTLALLTKYGVAPHRFVRFQSPRLAKHQVTIQLPQSPRPPSADLVQRLANRARHRRSIWNVSKRPRPELPIRSYAYTRSRYDAPLYRQEPIPSTNAFGGGKSGFGPLCKAQFRT